MSDVRMRDAQYAWRLNRRLVRVWIRANNTHPHKVRVFFSSQDFNHGVKGGSHLPSLRLFLCDRKRYILYSQQWLRHMVGRDLLFRFCLQTNLLLLFLQLPMWHRRIVLWWRRLFVSVYYYHSRLYNCLDRRCCCRSYNQYGRVFRYRYIHRGLLLLCLLPVLSPSFAGDGDCVAAGKPAVRDHNANVGHTANAAVPSARELQSAPTRLWSASSALSKLPAAANPVSPTSSTRPAFYASTSQR